MQIYTTIINSESITFNFYFQNATKIIEELENIVSNCSSLNLVQVDSCAVNKYNNISQTIKPFENTTVTLLVNAQKNATQIIGSATKCINNCTMSFISKVNDEVDASYTCINN